MHVAGLFADSFPSSQAQHIAAAVEAGFQFHHAEGQQCVMTKWLCSSKNMLPPFATATLGVGAFVVNAKRYISPLSIVCSVSFLLILSLT
jgi:hypothetical protein